MTLFGFTYFSMLNPNLQAIFQEDAPIQCAVPVTLRISRNFLCCLIQKLENDKIVSKFAQFWLNATSWVTLLG